MADLISKEQMRTILSSLKKYIDNKSDGINSPLGTIIQYMGITAPSNYLACDGRVYIIEEYKELANFFKEQFGSYNFFGGDGETTFAVPDLRGEFLRGTGTNSHTNQGSGANVGVHQDGTMFPYIFDYSKFIFRLQSNPAISSPSNVDKDIGSRKSSIQVTGTVDSSVFDDQATEFTSRPTNTSVLYCIRYNSPQSYSTTEKVIGTWIDGKPLYQKTYQVTTPSTINSYSTIISNLGPINITSINGYLIQTNVPHHIPVNISFGNQNISTFASYDTPTNACIMMYTNVSAYTSAQCYITLQYTKTTD